MTSRGTCHVRSETRTSIWNVKETCSAVHYTMVQRRHIALYYTALQYSTGTLHYIASSHCSTVSAVLGTTCKGVSTERHVPMDAVPVTHAFEIVKCHFNQVVPM